MHNFILIFHLTFWQKKKMKKKGMLKHRKGDKFSEKIWRNKLLKTTIDAAVIRYHTIKNHSLRPGVCPRKRVKCLVERRKVYDSNMKIIEETRPKLIIFKTTPMFLTTKSKLYTKTGSMLNLA